MEIFLKGNNTSTSASKSTFGAVHLSRICPTRLAPVPLVRWPSQRSPYRKSNDARDSEEGRKGEEAAKYRELPKATSASRYLVSKKIYRVQIRAIIRHDGENLIRNGHSRWMIVSKMMGFEKRYFVRMNITRWSIIRS